jgi:hypothetical protein
MSDRAQSWHYGDCRPVVTKEVASATVIEVGDLIEMETNGAVASAADHVWNTNLATTQEEFHDEFLGVAQERSRNGDTNPIRVNTAGVHEFDCAAATFELGALVGPAKQAGNALEKQKVVAVATENLAIGRVAKRYGSNTTKVFVEVFSRVMSGGAQVMA